MTNKEAILMLERIMYDEDNYGTNWGTGAKEAFEMAISALEKQIPKKIQVKHHTKYGWSTFYPNCNRMDVEFWHYCPSCGQAIVSLYTQRSEKDEQSN